MYKTRRQRSRTSDTSLTEITVYDYANSKSAKIHKCGRLKKGAAVAYQNQAKMSGDKSALQDCSKPDLSWYEKDEEDFDDPINRKGLEDEEENVDMKAPHASRSKKKKNRDAQPDPGVTFPIDLWFQLSFYIHPESVGSFARLCKGSNAVVHSVHFWKNLYTRFYSRSCELPTSLQPEHLECIHGLRERVIRSLFIMYSPLVERSKTIVPFQNEPHVLKGQRCLLTWHRKVKNVWKFYFKFRKGDQVSELDSNMQRSIKSRLFPRWHQDLHYNPENAACIMEVTCANFQALPIVMGQILTNLYLNVSSGMRYHRLRAMFDTSLRASSARAQHEMTEVILDPVLELRIFPWWSPKFSECMEEEF